MNGDNPTADDMLGRLAREGGVIVSASKLSAPQIATARAQGRLHVRADAQAFVWFPDAAPGATP